MLLILLYLLILKSMRTEDLFPSLLFSMLACGWRVERITEFVREILTRAKRVKFNKFFLPVGFTPDGYRLFDGFSSWSAVTEDTRDF